MAGVQAERTLAAAREFDPALEPRYRELNGWQEGDKPNYSPPPAYNARLGLLVRDLCERHGLLDRMPRHIAPGPLAVNKRVAERLFLKTYDLELEQAYGRRIWAYRKAAWTVDEWPQSVAKIYHARGEAGLHQLPGIGKRLSGLIGKWLEDDRNVRGTAR